MDPESTVAVVVVNYRTRDLLRTCLESIRTHAADTHVIVVDNASDDGSAAMVREEFPEVQLIANTRNVGYGAAANRAIAATRSRYVLLLNGDTELQPDTVSALATYLDANPRAGLAGPRLTYPDGTAQVSAYPFPGTIGWLLENEPLLPIYRRTPAARRNSVGFRAEAGPRRVPWVLGAALMIRRQAFDAVGGFDGGFFMYFEEVDLARRLERTDWEIHFAPVTTVRHVGGASTSQLRFPMLVRHFQSTLLYYRRHSSFPGYLFWQFLMRVKAAALLVRDGARLIFERDSERRELLTEQVRAWAARLSFNGKGPSPLV